MSKKIFLLVVLLSVLLAGTALAQFNVNINIGTPPPVAVSTPPTMAVIPGTYVYIATSVGNTDIMFYQDNWYRPHNGGWFVSVNYNGPWKQVSAPPAALTSLPPNYHNVPPDGERMPYSQVKNNWRTWEHDRHWDRVAERRGGDREREDRHHEKHKKKKHHGDDNERHEGDRDRDSDRDRNRHHDRD